MTSYLLIDLDKSAVGCVAPTGDTSRVFLFAKKKNNRQLAADFAAENPQVVFVKVGKDETVAEILAQKLKKLIKKQPDARFLIDSPRGKVMKAVDKLLNRFPDAHVMMLDVAQNDDEGETDDAPAAPSPTPPQTQTHKETAAPIAHKPDWQPENIKLTLPQSANKNANPAQSAKKKKIPVSKKPDLLPERKTKSLTEHLEESPLFSQQTLLDKVAQNHDKADKSEHFPAFEHMLSRLDDVIGILTKGYPKKKEVLLMELAQTLNVSQADAETMFGNLVNNGMMKVENGNQVKITNLIHLLKLK